MRGFTEAVPLSLSSMAHMTMPLEEGVVDGIRQVLQHTLLSCVNYARAMIPPSSWTFSDLGTSAFAWKAPSEATKINVSAELPPALHKMGFQHVYPRTCFVYLKQKSKDNHGMAQSHSQELAFVPTGKQSKPEREWTHHPNILAKVSLLYTTKELMTPGELNGTEVDEDTPPCVLYKIAVEYRSLPATGNRSAVQAEELSMLSFGGSVDDDVKYGALASLYDPFAKYVLEIYSVRGKKYKFDLMDSTLSNGTVPRLPSKPTRSKTNGNAVASSSSSSERPSKMQATESASQQDPFVKSLCVTVTDHHEAQPPPPPPATNPADQDKKPENDKESAPADTDKDTEGDDAKTLDSSKPPSESAASNKASTPNYAITRIHLTMEGQLRTSNLKELPNFHEIAQTIQSCFLSLRAHPPELATCTPSGHTLLLDPKEAGRIYIHGRYVTTWGKDPRIGSSNGSPALFGMDLHSVPFWHGRIFDFDILKRHYGQLWQEVLIDASLMPMEIASRLLSRLCTGKDPPHIRAATRKRLLAERRAALAHDDIQNGANPDGPTRMTNVGSMGPPPSVGDGTNSAVNGESNDGEDDDDDDGDDEADDINMSCLEAHVMQSKLFDPVGISAKALATRFKMEYGPAALPCQSHEVEWIKDWLPYRIPVVVPARAIAVLQRGGYFDAQRTADEDWFAESRKAQGTAELMLLRMALAKLIDAGVTDVSVLQIVFATNIKKSIPNPLSTRRGVVRRNAAMRQYHVHEGFLEVDVDDGVRAYLLGFHIAQEHPDGNVLTQYLIRNKK